MFIHDRVDYVKPVYIYEKYSNILQWDYRIEEFNKTLEKELES